MKYRENFQTEKKIHNFSSETQTRAEREKHISVDKFFEGENLVKKKKNLSFFRSNLANSDPSPLVNDDPLPKSSSIIDNDARWILIARIR